MEKPSWAPLVFSGAVPKGVADGLAMVTIGMIGLESALAPGKLASVPVGLWFLTVAVPLVCALASLSDTARKLREELAIFAYGGSSFHVWARYFLRGLACALLAILPYFVAEYYTVNYSSLWTALPALFISVLGGVFYAAPSLTRFRSAAFAENYKG